jgi:hypothetical protein
MEAVELIKIQSMIDDLSQQIKTLIEEHSFKEVQLEHRSNDIKDLAAALAKAQLEMPVAELNKNNPYFKSAYADLKSIVGASRPYLAKNGLSVTQQIYDDADGANWLLTTLWHVSGQWICSKRRIVPSKNDIQTISSHTTYMKRMCYASLIGVVTGDEDDDGEVAVATTRDTFAKGTSLNTNYNPKENVAETITKEQLAELEYELADYPDICEMVLDGLKIPNLCDMPKQKYQAAATRIREIKAARGGKR